MEVSFLRVYLFCGLLFHKAVWEYLKHRRPPKILRISPPLKARLLVWIKIGLLLAIVVQIFRPDFLPMLRTPNMLRGIGAMLYSFGLLVAVIGRIQLGTAWSDIEKSSVQMGHELVERGLYRFMRHPIYTGDLLLLLGLELALNSWCVALIALIAIYVWRRAKEEERQLIQAFSGYDKYCRRTGRFLPLFLSGKL